MSSETLRPASQLNDGCQLFQTARTGVHRSPFSLNMLAYTPARMVLGVVLSGAAPHSAVDSNTHSDEQEMQSRSTEQVMDITHDNLRDPIFIIQVIKALK